jgi:hypothetical protein
LAAALNSHIASTTLSVDRSITFLVDMQMEVFVRSFSANMAVETCRDMVQHPFCAPETAGGLVREALSNFKGRFFSQEDSFVLERVLDIADKTKRSVKIYDLSKLADKFKAVRHGIFKTPVVMVDGVRYKSLEDSLSVMLSDSNP